MVEQKNYRIKSFVRERDFLANNFKNSYGYYLLDKPLYKEEIILHLSVDKEDNFVSINVNYANGTVFAPFYKESLWSMESRKMIVWKHLVMVDLAVRIRKRNDINAKFGRNVNACRCNESFKIR